MTVLAYGALNPDIVHRVDRLPAPGDDIRSTAWRLTWGGKAANMAVALADWGVDVRLTGLVIGQDPLGDSLLTALRRPRLDLSDVERDPHESTRHCVVLVDPAGERTIVCTGYRDARWSGVRRWDDVDAVVADGQAGARAAVVVREASRRSIPTVWLDAPPRDARYADLVVWSRHEHTPSEAAALARRETAVALTGGAAPVLVWWAGERLEVRPPQVPYPRDTTGAGDVFAAACARGLRLGWPPTSVIESAVATAAAAVAGGRSG